MNKHPNAKPDIKYLYNLLEGQFKDEPIRIYRTGSRKQTLSISANIYEPILIKFLLNNKEKLQKYELFSRIWMINCEYFMDYSHPDPKSRYKPNFVI